MPVGVHNDLEVANLISTFWRDPDATITTQQAAIPTSHT
jgi:hypothetical protein